MAYVAQTRIESAIPPQILVAALDDDRDGAADPGRLADIIAAAGTAVDSLLGSLYPTPFSAPYPAAAKEAAFIFACELVYQRREISPNPFTDRADFWRQRLEKVGAGKLPLDANQPRAFSPGAAIVEISRTWDGATPVTETAMAPFRDEFEDVDVGTDTFTLSQKPVAQSVSVFLNRAMLASGEYAVSGQVLTLVNPTTSPSDNVIVIGQYEP